MSDIDELARRASAATRAEAARVAGTEEALASMSARTAQPSRWPLILLAAAAVLSVVAIGVWALSDNTSNPTVIGSETTATTPGPTESVTTGVPSSPAPSVLHGPWEDAGFTMTYLPEGAVFSRAYLSRDTYENPVWSGDWTLPGGTLTLGRSTGRTGLPAVLPPPGTTTTIEVLQGIQVLHDMWGSLRWIVGDTTLSVGGTGVSTDELRKVLLGISYDAAKDQYRDRLPSGPDNEVVYGSVPTTVASTEPSPPPVTTIPPNHADWELLTPIHSASGARAFDVRLEPGTTEMRCFEVAVAGGLSPWVETCVSQHEGRPDPVPVRYAWLDPRFMLIAATGADPASPDLVQAEGQSLPAEVYDIAGATVAFALLPDQLVNSVSGAVVTRCADAAEQALIQAASRVTDAGVTSTRAVSIDACQKGYAGVEVHGNGANHIVNPAFYRLVAGAWQLIYEGTDKDCPSDTPAKLGEDLLAACLALDFRAHG